MITLDTFLIYLIPVLILSFSPGPGMLFVSGRALAQGRNMGLLSVLGLELGAFVHVLAATLGLSTLLIANPHLLILIQVLGACYLLYLAAQEIKAKKKAAHKVTRNMKHYAPKEVFKQGIFTSLINPKITLFIFAFIPTFINTSKNVPLQFITLGLIFNATGLIVNSAVVLLVSAFGQARFLNGNTANHMKHWLVAVLFICLAMATFFDVTRSILKIYS